MMLSAVNRILCFALCLSCQWRGVLGFDEEFEQSIYLDTEENFQMLWNFDETHITFELRVATTGWVGIGISPTGTMLDADMHVGWIRDGKVYMTDRNGQNFYPFRDKEQNLELLGGRECDGVTKIKFRRQLAACERGADRAITRDTTRMIYAFGVNDPLLSDLFFTDKHAFRNRGTKNVLLLTRPIVLADAIDEDASSFEVRNLGEEIPQLATYYHCQITQIPSFNQKQHILKIDPIVNEENRRNVHHMLVYRCPRVLQNPSDVGRGFDCYNNAVIDHRRCFTLVTGWAVGGESLVLPENVGFPVGEPGDTTYFMLETHYDNPTFIEIRDTSGFRFTYTQNLRDIDAGMLQLGARVSGFSMAVPPGMDSFNVYGDCSAACLTAAMRLAGVDSINVSSNSFHSHLAGRKMNLRHIRAGVELPPIDKDDGYDFNFQTIKPISPEVVIRRGDEIELICEYSSSDRSRVIESGTSTMQEMCLSFVVYYPRLPLLVCNSSPSSTVQAVSQVIGVRDVRQINRDRHPILYGLSDLIITDPPEMANKTMEAAISEFPWTKEMSDALSDTFRILPQRELCAGPQPLLPFFNTRSSIAINEPLLPDQEDTCTAPSTGFETDLDEEDCPVA